jgi:hypothetical protein
MVAKFASHATTPGTGAASPARLVAVEVPDLNGFLAPPSPPSSSSPSASPSTSPSMVSSPDSSTAAAVVLVLVWVGAVNSSPVRVPMVVRTRGSVSFV